MEQINGMRAGFWDSVNKKITDFMVDVGNDSRSAEEIVYALATEAPMSAKEGDKWMRDSNLLEEAK